MIGEKTQRIFRELSMIKDPIPQSELARRCDCSLSFVNKEIKDLVNRRLIGRPSRTRISLTNRPGLMVLWVGRRSIRTMDIKVKPTNLGLTEAFEWISSMEDHALTLGTAARRIGIGEGVTENELHVYLPPNIIKGLKVPKGEAGVRLVMLPSNDGHLYRSSMEVDGVKVAPEVQVFVDLADWGTWEAHNIAVKMAMERDGYPIFATRVEMEAFL